jgi:RNA polymerase sigma-70 factor (ECF subfamily)
MARSDDEAPTSDAPPEVVAAADPVVALLDAGDPKAAVTLALRTYGAEVFAFLRAFHKNADDAEEVFARFAEALWQALPSFERRSGLRTFVYAIARRTSLRFRRDAGRQNKRLVPIDDDATTPPIVAFARTETKQYLRTEVRTKLTALRESLSPADQEILLLRVDRKLAWTDLALVLAGEGKTLTGDALKKEAARLRKRFQIIKDRLRELGRKEGLWKDEDEGPLRGAGP